MHINEAYEHTPILSYPSEDTETCPSGCSKNAMQCVDISEPVVLTPTASLGKVTTSCQGSPEVSCVTNAEGTACTVTLTQRVCVTIPVTYGVDSDSGEPSIACADHPGDAHPCGCGL